MLASALETLSRESERKPLRHLGQWFLNALYQFSLLQMCHPPSTYTYSVWRSWGISDPSITGETLFMIAPRTGQEWSRKALILVLSQDRDRGHSPKMCQETGSNLQTRNHHGGIQFPLKNTDELKMFQWSLWLLTLMEHLLWVTGALC